MSKSKGDPGTRIQGDLPPDEHTLVDAGWLLKAVAATLLAAAVLAYGAYCLLFYQGQWQIVLHPAPMQAVPANALPPHEDVRFAVTEGGVPTLFGWWIPADPGARMQGDVLVYFPAASGSLSSRTATLTYWHQQRINVFAFDYRGFGNSTKLHPSEQSMKDDGISVVRYLIETRHIAADHIVLAGESLGCVSAIHAATVTPGVAATILLDPRQSQRDVFVADARTRLLPMRLLLREDFSLAPELASLKTPTLVVSSFGTQQNHAETRQVFDAIDARKAYFERPPRSTIAALTLPTTAFLDSVFMPAGQGSGSAPARSQGK